MAEIGKKADGDEVKGSLEEILYLLIIWRKGRETGCLTIL